MTAAALTSRVAVGLAEGARWEEYALCTPARSGLWHMRETYGLARHLCEFHCPVLAKCQVDNAERKWDGCVIAGIAWTQATNKAGGSKPLEKQPKASRRGCWLC